MYCNPRCHEKAFIDRYGHKLSQMGHCNSLCHILHRFIGVSSSFVFRYLLCRLIVDSTRSPWTHRQDVNSADTNFTYTTGFGFFQHRPWMLYASRCGASSWHVEVKSKVEARVEVAHFQLDCGACRDKTMCFSYIPVQTLCKTSVSVDSNVTPALSKDNFHKNLHRLYYMNTSLTSHEGKWIWFLGYWSTNLII